MGLDEGEDFGDGHVAAQLHRSLELQAREGALLIEPLSRHREPAVTGEVEELDVWGPENPVVRLTRRV